jgi:hypothetical protein
MDLDKLNWNGSLILSLNYFLLSIFKNIFHVSKVVKSDPKYHFFYQVPEAFVSKYEDEDIRSIYK